MKSVPVLNRLIPPLLMTANIIQILIYLLCAVITLCFGAIHLIAGKSPGFLILIPVWLLFLAVPAALLICFYSQLTRGKLGLGTIRFGWMVSCIYHALMIWQDVFADHGRNYFPFGPMNVPLWTLSALAFVASLYAFLLLLEEHPQAGIRNPFLS